ncbi:MAG TPA: RDD family protein [Candidatus Limnocylindria bacterium]|nr:RDD family protein [Candidatus Limnocylindria bacterium]
MTQEPRDPNAPPEAPPQQPSAAPPPPPAAAPAPQQSWQSQAQPPAAAPPPQQSWQSQPQQPGAPPAGGGMPPGGGMPSWTSNITASGTIAGPGGLALADLPNRIIAVVIDFIIIGIVGFIVGAIIHPILGDRITFGGGVFFPDVVVPSLVSSLIVALIMAAVSAGYFIYMWLKMGGATVGMRVLKLQVRDAASGGAISQDQAIRRWAFLAGPAALNWFYGWGLGLIISLLVLGYYIYLLVTTAQSPTRQGLHDKQANTVIAKVA